MELSYAEGEKMYWVRLGVLGLQRSLHLSGPLLRGTWAAIRGWAQLQPTQSRTPISWFVLQCFLVTCLARGNAAHHRARLEWWNTMLASWVCFEALLRPGEADQLVVGDLFFPEASEVAAGVALVICIRKPKTRHTWIKQFAMITNAALISWLEWWVMDRRRHDKLFPVYRRRWASLFAEAVGILHLKNCSFTLGSLRGGGATHHFRTHRNLGELQFAGRWKRPETLKHYLQEAVSIQVICQAPASAKELLTEAHAYTHLLSAPPPRALSSLL